MSTNILEKWHKEALIISSPLNITQVVSRDKVSFIYGKLYSFFGLNYFILKRGEDKPIEKISWLYSLLANNTHIGCITALLDIALLIDYSTTLDSSIQKGLKDLKKSPQNLRTFFFELYIFRLLDSNNIPNRKKITVNNQELEGTCTIMDEECLFECRKVFMPRINEFDIVRRLMTNFWQHGNTLRSGYGMICTIELKRPLKGEHHFSFVRKIKKFFEDFNNFRGTVQKIEYFIEDEFGAFRAVDYDEATLIETKNLKKYDVLFYIVPPKNLIAGIPNRYDINITCSFSILEDKIYQKLESVLKEKKSQHKNSTYKNKIIFIDSETFPEFQMALFQNEAMYNYDRIKNIYEKLHLQSIVCIIRRIYLKEQPEILIDIFYPEDMKQASNYLKKLLTQKDYLSSL